jgi:hypothetical protein
MSNVVSPNFPNGPLRISPVGQPSALQQLVAENVLPPTYQVLEGFLFVGAAAGAYTGPAGFASTLPAADLVYPVVDRNGNYLLLPLGQQIVAMSIAATSPIVGNGALTDLDGALVAGFVGCTINPITNLINTGSLPTAVSSVLPQVSLNALESVTTDTNFTGAIVALPASSLLTSNTGGVTGGTYDFLQSIASTATSQTYCVAIAVNSGIANPIASAVLRVLVTVV